MTTPLALAFLAFATPSEAGKAKPGANDTVVVKSESDFAATVGKLEKALLDRDLTVFGKIDHAVAAKNEGIDLPPSTLLLFGDPKMGSALMRPAPTLGLDLPLRILVLEQKPGNVTVRYHPIDSVAAAHGVDANDEAVGKVGEALQAIVSEATRD